MAGNVVVIGNFDGVHLGHRAVLSAARELVQPGGELIAVTFWPHPTWVIRPGHGPLLLTEYEHRADLLRDAGADRVEMVRFDAEVAGWSPEEFVTRVLRPLAPSHVVVGENFRFGHRAAGTAETLAELADGQFEVNGLELVEVSSHTASSTAIREALAAGDVESAAAMLGRRFTFGGVVVHGDERGRELGFPTANQIVPDERAVPADGVYAGWVRVRQQPELGVLPAAVSVGTNPTFNGVQHRVESNILGTHDLNLYDSWIDVEFVTRLRGQVRFTGIEDLIAQMTDDVEKIRVILDDDSPDTADLG